LIIGLCGAIGSTVVAGVELMRRGLSPRAGILTERALMPRNGRLHMSDDARGGYSMAPDPSARRMIAALDMPELDQLVFSGWDVRKKSVLEAGASEHVIAGSMLQPIKDTLGAAMPLEGITVTNGVATGGWGERKHSSLRAAAQALQSDIQEFKTKNGLKHVVLVDLSPTAPIPNDTDAHHTVRAFEKGLDSGDASITANMLYFYAACRVGCAYVNFTPNLVEVESLRALSRECKVPFAGKDGKTGQTFVKTVLAPGFRDRSLRVRGWFSGNILGNNDGKALSDPAACKTKILSKASVLDSILGYPVVSESGEPTHVISIMYYPPRGDAKESWDSIDLEGFLGTRMQLKLNFLCKDSILAAPLVIDLVRFSSLALRRGESGALDYLSMFFKSPLVSEGRAVQHDFFEQTRLLAEHLERAGA
jgi:myo-inositol-1-phosphate synthase